MGCSHQGNCGLFSTISMNSALKVWQTFYCESDFAKCERYKRSLAGFSVPATLLPNGKMIEAQPAVPAQNKEDSVPAMAAQAVSSVTSDLSSYYVRARIARGADVDKEISNILQSMDISVDGAIRKAIPDNPKLECLILITDQVASNSIYGALPKIEALSEVTGIVKCIPLEKMDSLIGAAASAA